MCKDGTAFIAILDKNDSSSSATEGASGSESPKIKKESASMKKTQSNKLFATMSFTFDLRKGNYVIMESILLSIGEGSKFIHFDHIYNMRNIESVRDGLGPKRLWFVSCCEVDDDIQKRRLITLIMKSANDRGGLSDLAWHTLFSKRLQPTGSPLCHIPADFQNDTIVFPRLDVLYRRNESHITLHSHLPRKKALHSFLLENKKSYAAAWSTSNRETETFYREQYLNLCVDEPVSFQYPTIQYGFQTSPGPRPLLTARFKLSDTEPETHHRFVTHKHRVNAKTFHFDEYKPFFMDNAGHW